MAVKQGVFRIGKVRGDLRGKVWYLTYFEDGRRRRPRVGSDKDAAKQMAAQIHSQLEVRAPAALSFEAVSLDELQARWLRQHEHVLRSSVQTIIRAELLRRIAENNCALWSDRLITRERDGYVAVTAPRDEPNGTTRS